MGGACGRCGCCESFTSTRHEASGWNRSTAPHAPKRGHKADNKKVRSEGCFAVHFLFISCAEFGRMVRRVTFEAGRDAKVILAFLLASGCRKCYYPPCFKESDFRNMIFDMPAAIKGTAGRLTRIG